MYTITAQLANARQAERLREADHARLATSARPVRGPARRHSPAATPAGRVIRAILLRAAV
jgi:hypothetical protein